MKLIIAGSRTLSPSFGFLVYSFTQAASTFSFTFDEIVSGGASGVDLEGEHLAHELNLPIKRFLPDWGKFGTRAGPLRNKEMAKYADALLLIWDGESRGAKSMRDEMLKLKKPIYEVILKKTNG